tara:strand:- start:3664 stop:4101 length:438 start_codon:yes stop_codon:yes gene_type:complete
MKKSITILLFCAFILGATEAVSAQESYAGALNVFASFGNKSAVNANYEFALGKNLTISPEATIPFDFDYMFAGARVDYYFDSLLELNEPWDIWAGGGAGFMIGKNDIVDGINLNFHVGGEYKFNQKWGVILEGGNVFSLGVGIHL